MMKFRVRSFSAILLTVALLLTSVASYAVAAPYQGITLMNSGSGLIVPLLDDDGYLYVTDYSAGKVYRMNPDGSSPTVIMTANQPIGIVKDGSTIYVAEHAGSKILQYSGGSPTTLVTASSLLTGMVQDSHGDLFALNYSNGKILKYSFGSSTLSDFKTGLGTNTLIGLAIDSDDNLYVTDRTNSKVIKVTPDGTTTDFITGASLTCGVSLGADGYMYVSTSSRLIKKYDLDGTLLATINTGTVTPWGSAVDGAGFVYFTGLNANVYRVAGSAVTDDMRHVKITLNAILTPGSADPDAFTLAGAASNPTVTSADVSGSDITLTLSDRLTTDDSPLTVSYEKTGTNDLVTTGSAITVSDFANQPIWNTIKKVTAVQSPGPITVEIGTPLGEVPLPETVVVTLNDASTTSSAIVWDGGAPAYEADVEGDYLFTGTLEPSEWYSNPNSRGASVTVSVVSSSLEIVSVQNPDPFSVDYGTTYAQLPFPDSVVVTLEDDTTTSAAITWDGGSPAYDGEAPGDYSFTGTIALVDGITNPQSYSANLDVTVERAARRQSGESGTPVSVDGRTFSAGTTSTVRDESGFHQVVTVDDARVQTRMLAEGDEPSLLVVVPGMSGAGESSLGGDTLRLLNSLNGQLEVRTSGFSYVLPGSSIDMGLLQQQLGLDASISDLQLRIQILQAPAPLQEFFDAAVGQELFQAVAPPVEFSLMALQNGVPLQLPIYHTFTQRIMPLGSSFNRTGPLTGLVIEPDGTFRPVPVRLVMLADGSYSAVISSLTDSAYAVVSNLTTFTDTGSHWANAAIGELAGRMMLKGTGNGMFMPEKRMTRAEFAALLVRALGLPLSDEAPGFSDVSEKSWYAGYIAQAHEQGLLPEMQNGLFHPDALLTRDQAMQMISLAISKTSLNGQIAVGSLAGLLAAFPDSGSLSSETAHAAAVCLQTGIVLGRTDGSLDVDGIVTRAEGSVLVLRLLRNAGLIDQPE